jgi:hypothetical protein
MDGPAQAGNQGREEPSPGCSAQCQFASGKLATSFEGDVAKDIVNLGIHASDASLL